MLTRTEIAAILRFTADLLCGQPIPAIVPPIDGEQSDTPPAKRPGRPRKADQANAAATETAPVGQTATAEVKTPEPEKPKVEGGKTLDELRAVFRPLIDKFRGEEVKKVLNKYKPSDWEGDYTAVALAEHPEHHAAFVQDIEMLKM
jgi:hypothetical protein